MVECPRDYCRDLTDDINIASCAGKGFLPVAGGLLDQTNWFMQLWAAIDEEHAAIDAERWNSGK